MLLYFFIRGYTILKKYVKLPLVSKSWIDSFFQLSTFFKTDSYPGFPSFRYNLSNKFMWLVFVNLVKTKKASYKYHLQVLISCLCFLIIYKLIISYEIPKRSSKSYFKNSNRNSNLITLWFRFYVELPLSQPGRSKHIKYFIFI